MARQCVQGSPGSFLTGAPTFPGVPFTVAAFFNTTNPAIGNDQEIFLINPLGAGTVDNIGMKIVNASSKLACFTSDGGGVFNTVTVNTVLTANTWYSAVFSEVSTVSRVAYLNGVGTSNSTSASLATQNFGGCWVGSYLGNNNTSFNGPIAEVAVWSVALTAGEAAAYNAGCPAYMIRPKSLLGYWPLWGLVSPEPDLSGLKFALTLTGAPAKANHAPVTLWTPKWAQFAELPADILYAQACM